jgi:hypothetical protein
VFRNGGSAPGDVLLIEDFQALIRVGERTATRDLLDPVPGSVVRILLDSIPGLDSLRQPVLIVMRIGPPSSLRFPVPVRVIRVSGAPRAGAC